MIPEFHNGISLSVGPHPCTLQEIQQRFCGNGARRMLCQALENLLLRAKSCGFLKAAIGGSFPTVTMAPGDLDIIWFTAAGVCKDNVPPDCVQLMDDARAKAELGHNMLYIPLKPENPDETVLNMVTLLGYDVKTQTERGMLVVDLTCL